MRIHHRLQAGTFNAIAAISLSLVSCSAADDRMERAEAISATDQAIIGGVDANSAALNAVGALVRIYRYTDYYCEGGYGSGGTDSGSGYLSGSRTDRVGGTDRVKRNHRHALNGAGGAAAIDSGTSSGGSTSTTNGTGTCAPIEYEEYYPFCSGTLVGQTAVLTAKHCLNTIAEARDGDIVFAVGPNAFAPVATYPIVDWDWETKVPAVPGSVFADLGNDVGVAHLGEAVKNITPFAIGTPTARDVGTRFTALGYGIQNNHEDYGTRKAGSMTLRGFGGNYADWAFGGLDGFVEEAPNIPAFSWYSDEELSDVYDAMGLIPNYQAFFGGKPGDAEACYGDSGGPIVATRNGVRTVFGNITSGLGSSSLICDYGTIGAIFGPLTKSYLKSSLKWVDPCEGTSVKGRCDGDSAVRCTSRNEGARRLVVTDCGMLAQTCGLDDNGAAACVDFEE